MKASTTSQRWTRRRRWRASALGLSAVLALAATTSCADESGGSGDGGEGAEGVEFGASKADYQEALADMDPVELNVQTLAAFDAANGRPSVAYWDAVEDWSGGKITFNRTPSSGIAPLPEAFEALNDGRLDQTTVLPSYSPQEFPVNTAISEMGHLGSQTPILGDLVNNAVNLELAYNAAPEALEEGEKVGALMLFPAYSSGQASWACTEERRSLDQLSGAAIRAGDTAIVKRIEAVGAEASFIPVAEIFEGLQRGVVDCASAGTAVHQAFGYMPEAPYLTLDPEVGLGRGLAGQAISLATWEELPLAAQQLLFDRLDAFMEEHFLASWQAVAEVIEATEADGGGTVPFADDARQRLQQVNDDATEAMRSDPRLSDPDGFVQAALDTSEEWEEVVTDLGLVEATDWAEFASSFSRDSIDLQPYMDKVYEEILLPHRPS
jgi:TRAP-type C4-dicarboxylate transport system substrate-binding protein